MKKTLMLFAALVSTQALAQLPIPLPPVPGLPGVPTLPTPPAFGGSAALVVNGTGVIVTVDSTQTPPASVTPVGLPPLPGLPALP